MPVTDKDIWAAAGGAAAEVEEAEILDLPAIRRDVGEAGDLATAPPAAAPFLKLDLSDLMGQIDGQILRTGLDKESLTTLLRGKFGGKTHRRQLSDPELLELLEMLQSFPQLLPGVPIMIEGDVVPPPGAGEPHQPPAAPANSSAGAAADAPPPPPAHPPTGGDGRKPSRWGSTPSGFASVAEWARRQIQEPQIRRPDKPKKEE